MKFAEMVEMVLVAVIAAGTWWFAGVLPTRLGLGRLLLYGSALLLLQSLLRDLWLLARARRQVRVSPPRVIQCMCVESMVGMTGVIIGLLLLSVGLGASVGMERWGWSLFVAVVLGMGFLIKDYVVETRPWRLRRDKDHLSIIVKWRKGHST
jgi:hypothetical protein